MTNESYDKGSLPCCISFHSSFLLSICLSLPCITPSSNASKPRFAICGVYRYRFGSKWWFFFSSLFFSPLSFLHHTRLIFLCFSWAAALVRLKSIGKASNSDTAESCFSYNCFQPLRSPEADFRKVYSHRHMGAMLIFKEF